MKDDTLSLFLISQTKNNDYDTYDSAVVVARTIDEARDIYPNGEDQTLRDRMKEQDADLDRYHYHITDWARYEYIKCQYIGIADIGFKRREVVCASYNAG